MFKIYILALILLYYYCYDIQEDKKEIQDRKNQEKNTGDEDQLFNDKGNDKDGGNDKKKIDKK